MALTDPAVYLPFTGVLFALSAVLTRLMLWVGILDTPNQRSSHLRPVARGGGVGIVAACLAAVAVYFAWGGEGDAVAPGILAVASLGVAGVGLLDDFGRLNSFRIKLLVQFLAAALLVGWGGVFSIVPVPWGPAVNLGGWGYPLTILWLLGLTNAFNFMDGLDGLAAGTAAVAALFFGLIALAGGAAFPFVASFAVLAGTLGFLVFNVPPAKIFMGDVGSQFLGFFFAALAVIAAQGEVSAVSPLVMPLLFFHFIFDTAFTFTRRLLDGRTITDAHRGHLYQLVNRLGVSHAGVSLFHVLMAGIQGAGAYWLIGLPAHSQWIVFLPFLAFESGYAAIVWRLARRRGILEN